MWEDGKKETLILCSWDVNDTAPWERNLASSSAAEDVHTLPRYSRHTLWRNARISEPYVFTSALIVRAKRKQVRGPSTRR